MKVMGHSSVVYFFTSIVKIKLRVSGSLLRLGSIISSSFPLGWKSNEKNLVSDFLDSISRSSYVS